MSNHSFSIFKFVKKNLLIVFIITTSLIFDVLISLDIFEGLRGPNDLILESRWPYYFVNTMDKFWAPLSIFAVLLSLYYFATKTKLSRKKEIFFLFAFVVSSFAFQIALVYFSRFDIPVLFRRTVDPGINGYFSSATKIESVSGFVTNYEDEFPILDNHGRGHPPGGVIVLKWIIQFFDSNEKITNIFTSYIRPPNNDGISLWKQLTSSERAAAIFSAFFLHLLASLTIIPLYYLTKKIFSSKAAIKNIVLLILTPSFAFFALFFDPFYAVFPILVGLLLTHSYKEKSGVYAFIASLLSLVGLFFTISILPALILVFVIWTLFLIKKRKVWSGEFMTGVSGMLAGITFMYLMGYDFINVSYLVIRNQMPREYLAWVFYNPYDFFIYLGVPSAILFIYITVGIIRKTLEFKVQTVSVICFWIIFVGLTISGASRGEVGRIWIPLMMLPIFLSGDFLQNKIKSEKLFIAIVTLLFIQIIVMQEFWVSIW